MGWKKRAATSKQVSWGGKTQSSGAPTHHWQGWAAGRSGNLAPRSTTRWRWRFYFVVSIALLVALVILLTLTKDKTKLITVAVTDYDYPVSLNEWAQEDLDALHELSEGFDIQDISADWENRAAGFEAWEAALLSASKRLKRNPLVVYISMHGVVDDRGRPCLLPPRTSPLNTGSFIQVERLLDHIAENVPAKRKKLLIFDSNRIFVNWNMGIIYNTFPERLEQLIETKDVPNLAVITAASRGQQSVASADLGGSAFGRYLQLGLAGRADTEGGGDGDGAVRLHELVDYLQSQVLDWAWANRAEPQTVQLLPEAAADFQINWALKGKADALSEAFRSQPRAEPSIRSQDLATLWRQLESLRQHDPLRFDPLAWRNLEHRLLRLEQLAGAGKAYRDAATRELASLRGDLTATTQRAAKYGDSQMLAGHWRVFSDRIRIDRVFGVDLSRDGEVSGDDVSTTRPTLHTLPLCEYFGLADPVASVEARKSLMQLANAEVQPNKILKNPLVPPLAETQVLLVARHHDVPALWGRPNLLANLLQLRQVSERLAVPMNGRNLPGDERGHYYVRRALDLADRKRRELEDTMFFGPRNAVHDIDQLRLEVEVAHRWVSEIRDQVQQALAIRDQSWAETPYLASWLCRPLAPEVDATALDAAQQARDEIVQGDLDELIRRTGQLSDEIGRQTRLVPDKSVSFLAIADDVKTIYQRVQDQFARRCQELEEDWSPDAQTVRAIDAVMSAPLIPPERREKLMRLRSDIARKLHSDYLSGEDKRTEPSSLDSELLDSITRWEHPLAQVLGLPDELQNVSSSRIDGVSIADQIMVGVRRQLGELGSLEATTVARSADTLEDYRRLLRQSEERQRSAASIWFPPSDRTDPIAELRLFDLQQLLLWQRQRLIDGFWRSPNDGDIPFFAAAAGNCLQLVKRIAPTATLVEEQIQSQDQMLEQRKAADLAITAKSRPTVDTTGGILFSIDVAPKSDPLCFPPGSAAVFIRDKGQRVTDVAIEGGVSLPFDATALQPFQSRADGETLLSANLQAVTLFRGHEFQASFVVNRLDGVGVDFEPFVYGPPTITLRGDRPQRSSYIFILDCSNSMKNKIRMNEEDGEATVPRIEVAKRYLVSMLTELAPTDNRVGVKFVGHRIVYVKDPPKNPTRRQPRYPKHRIPRDLIPPHDVETIFRLREFDIIDANDVRRLLEDVEHWGQSPLYLALINSFKEFEPGDDRKGIIAITDGENLQQILSRDEDYRRPGETQVEKSDVLKRRNTVPVHFFDFARRPQDRNQEFSEIAIETGGTYHSATSGKNLLAALRRRLDLDGYVVFDGNDESINATKDGDIVPAKLNARVVVPAQRFRPQPYSIRFRSVQKDVPLEGGEAIELKVVRSGDNYDIVAVPFEPAEARAELVGSDGQPSDYIFRVQRPTRTESTARFSVSIQTTRSHFTERPSETWVQITPLLPNSLGHPYVFYDANFTPNQPVPVLSWSAENWPEEAKSARVEFWCKYVKSPALKLHLSRVIEQPDNYSEFRKLPNVPDVSAQVMVDPAGEGGRRIRVVQRHQIDPQDSSPADVFKVRVYFQSELQLRPDRIVRRFDESDGIATHEFYFSKEVWQAISDNAAACWLDFATRADVFDGALKLQANQNLDVRVYRAGGLLPVEAGRGVSD